MTGKRSVIAKAARRKAYSIRKEKKKADAARRVSTLAKGRSPNCPESTDYLKNSLDLFEFASEYSKLHCEEQGGFQDGTGTMANPPDWSSSAVLRPKKSKNPVTSILLDVIDKFGLEDLMRSCDTRTSPTPFSFMKLAKAFDEAATVARHALCKYLHVNNVPASSGAAFYAELYVALLQRSGDEDAGLKDLLINPHGFPAAILRNIPESGIFPVYQPNEMKILVHEPSSLAARFRRHYLSAERASDRLFSSVMSEIRQGKMQQESSEDGLTFVRCALIAKKGSPPEADLSDPEVAVRIVEDYSANGVNRLSVQNHLLHESPVLPQLSDYELVLRLIATHSQKTGISWGVGGLDYKAAFRNIPLDVAEAKFLAMRIRNPAGGWLLATHRRFPFGLRASPLIWARIASSHQRLVNWLLRGYTFISMVYVDDITIFAPLSLLPLIMCVYSLVLRTINFPIAWEKLFLNDPSSTVLGFNMSL